MIIILTNLSSDWRSISPKIDRGQAHAQWRSELLAANENHLPSQFTYVFPLLTSPFSRPTNWDLRGATAAREQALISNTAKAARPTRFESVIELPEVWEVSLSRTKLKCKSRNSAENFKMNCIFSLVIDWLLEKFTLASLILTPALDWSSSQNWSRIFPQSLKVT